VGRSDGERVGREVGFSKIGTAVGMNGCNVGITGASVGSAVGGITGARVGETLGRFVGFELGTNVG